MADKLQHTPGPWVTHNLPYNGFDDPMIFSTSQKNRFGDDDQYIAQTVYDMQSRTVRDTLDADTVLIAAAPCMLADLVEAERLLRYHGFRIAADRLAATIAKATTMPHA